MPYVELEDGGRMYYEEHGAGEPVVLLNGIMMNTASWAEFVPLLAPRVRLVLVDFRDQGRSSPRTGAYGLDDHARDLAALLEARHLEAAHLVGLSYGGQVALRLALRDPSRIRSLLLANVVRRIGPHLRAIGRAWETAAELDDGERFFRLAIPFIYSADFYESSADYLADRLELFKRALTRPWFEALVRLSRATDGYEIGLDELATLAPPTLLLGADEDLIAPLREMDAMREAIPSCEMVVFRRAGHGAFLERKQELVTLVLGFVAKHSPPGRP